MHAYWDIEHSPNPDLTRARAWGEVAEGLGDDRGYSYTNIAYNVNTVMKAVEKSAKASGTLPWKACAPREDGAGGGERRRQAAQASCVKRTQSCQRFLVNPCVCVRARACA